MPLYKLTDDAYKMEAWANKNDVPWSMWNNTRGFVILAPNEDAARQAASTRKPDDHEPWWLDPSLTKCIEIKDAGQTQIIIANQPTG